MYNGLGKISFSFNNTIYIQANELEESDIFIYNINGQLVGQDELKGDGLKRLHLNLTTGVYMVSLSPASSVWNHKVYIK